MSYGSFNKSILPILYKKITPKVEFLIKNHKEIPILGGALILPIILLTVLTIAAGEHSPTHNAIGLASIAFEAMTAYALLRAIKDEHNQDAKNLAMVGIINLGILFGLFIATDPIYPAKLADKNLSLDSIREVSAQVAKDMIIYTQRGVKNFGEIGVHASTK